MSKIELYGDLRLEFNKDLKLKLQEDTNVVVLAGILEYRFSDKV